MGTFSELPVFGHRRLEELLDGSGSGIVAAAVIAAEDKNFHGFSLS